MKFAGPSMGAALGSGLMGGMASAQELMTKEELARDTSAMATYAKLVKSGEWEPVGKDGVKDGGVLRVGNVGFLKKVAGSGGLDWKAANYMSQIKRREDLTRLGEEQLKLKQSEPKKVFAYYDPVSGRPLGSAEEGSPEALEYIRKGGAPLKSFSSGLPLTQQRFIEGTESSEIKMEVSDLSAQIDDKTRELGKFSKFELLPPAESAGVVKEGQDKAKRLRAEIATLQLQKKNKIKEMSRKGKRLGDSTTAGPTPPGSALPPIGKTRGLGAQDYVKPKGVEPPPEIIPRETWRKIAKEQRLSPEVGDKAYETVQNSGNVRKMIYYGLLKVQDLLDWISGEGSEEEQVGPPDVINKKRYKIKEVPDFVRQKK